MNQTNDEKHSLYVTLTEERIADLLKAISRLDSNGREGLMTVTDWLKKLEPDQRLIITRYSREADERRLAESRERVRKEREARLA